jgi:UV DNA damage endonuclease
MMSGEEKIYMRSVKLATIQKLGLDKILELYKTNLETTSNIVNYCINNDMRFYRFGDIFPFINHDILKSFKHLEQFDNEIYELGKLITTNDLRISVHSSPYCILSSAKNGIVEKSVRELKLWTDFLNLLGLRDDNRIVVHVGSSEGGKDAGKRRFVDVYNKLDPSIQKRIILENDDKTYSFSDVYEISSKTGIPIVIDIFHHRVHNPDKIDEIQALERSLKTWPIGQVPEIHFSCQDPLKHAGGHSASIDLDMIFAFLDDTKNLKFDIMLEVKDTNRSVEEINKEILSSERE